MNKKLFYFMDTSTTVVCFTIIYFQSKIYDKITLSISHLIILLLIRLLLLAPLFMLIKTIFKKFAKSEKKLLNPKWINPNFYKQYALLSKYGNYSSNQLLFIITNKVADILCFIYLFLTPNTSSNTDVLIFMFILSTILYPYFMLIYAKKQ